MDIDLTFLKGIDPAVISVAVNGLLLVAAFLFFFFIFRVFLYFWLIYRQNKYRKSIDYVLLAIDIPRDNEQSPKAVESIFSTLSGAYHGPNLKEKYIDGEVLPPFSLEIVSLEGYIQFLIRTPARFRDMVEAAVYAQYPDAEITEVVDYVDGVPSQFPSETHNLWGAEFTLAMDDAYPLRTYQYFEHSLSQEFKDPMSALLETFSRFGKGEQAWLQIVITPTSQSWKERGARLVKKLIGEKAQSTPTFVEVITNPLLDFFRWLADVIVGKGEATNTKEKQDLINKMQYLTPGEQQVVSAIQFKLAKIGFAAKMRYIYVAEKTVFNKAKGISSVLGALSQFNSLDLNSLVPSRKAKTKADYVRVEKRLAKKQNSVLRAYKERIGDARVGDPPFILNIEELATLYHFPVMQVKAPLVKKIEAKRAEPPVSLPLKSEEEEIFEDVFSAPAEQKKLISRSAEDESLKQDIKKELAIELDNAPFEKQFSKDKKKVNIHKRKKRQTGEKGSPPVNLPV